MQKRIISLLFILCLLLTFPVTVSANTDKSEDNYSEYNYFNAYFLTRENGMQWVMTKQTDKGSAEVKGRVSEFTSDMFSAGTDHIATEDLVFKPTDLIKQSLVSCDYYYFSLSSGLYSLRATFCFSDGTPIALQPGSDNLLTECVVGGKKCKTIYDLPKIYLYARIGSDDMSSSLRFTSTDKWVALKAKNFDGFLSKTRDANGDYTLPLTYYASASDFENDKPITANKFGPIATLSKSIDFMGIDNRMKDGAFTFSEFKECKVGIYVELHADSSEQIVNETMYLAKVSGKDSRLFNPAVEDYIDGAGQRGTSTAMEFHIYSGVNADLVNKNTEQDVRNAGLRKKTNTVDVSNDSLMTYARVRGECVGTGENDVNKLESASTLEGIEGKLGSNFTVTKDLTNHNAVGDIKLTDATAETLIQLFTLKVESNKLKEGWWGIELDFAFGGAKGATQNDDKSTIGQYYNSQTYNRTRRWVLHIKNSKDATNVKVAFQNDCYVVNTRCKFPEGYGDIRCMLDFSGGVPYNLKVAVYDSGDINVKKIEDGVGDSASVVKKGKTALLTIPASNSDKEFLTITKDDFDDNGTINLSVNKIKVEKDELKISTLELDGEGTYYVMFQARNNDYVDAEQKAAYITRWYKVEVNDNGEEFVPTESDAELLEQIHGRTTVERTLTFEQERMIDNINKDRATKAEMERWDFVYIILAFCGILVLAYSLLLIVAYYFDMLNSITEVSLYHKLTFGHMYPVGSAANIEHLNLSDDGKVKYATHVTAWISFSIGVIASAILMNGRAIVYLFLQLSNWFMSLISNIGG